MKTIYIIAAVLFALWVLIAWRNRRRVTFTAIDTNPGRRWCDRCGQCQQVEWDYDEHYWAAVGHIKDPSCPCHTRQD